jgi:hypothetical protein
MSRAPRPLEEADEFLALEAHQLAKRRIAALGDHPFLVRLDTAVELFDRLLREEVTGDI